MVLWCLHKHVDSAHFLGFKILSFNFFFFWGGGGGGGVQKMNGYENFVDLFWGHHKIELY